MDQKTEVKQKDSILAKEERVKKLIQQLEEDNQDPKFRMTVEELIRRHLGKSVRP